MNLADPVTPVAEMAEFIKRAMSKYAPQLDPAGGEHVVEVLNLEAANWCVDEGLRRFEEGRQEAPLSDAKEAAVTLSGKLLSSLDVSVENHLAALRVVLALLDARSQDEADLNCEECYDVHSTLHTSAATLQKEVGDWYKKRREALGIPDLVVGPKGELIRQEAEEE